MAAPTPTNPPSSSRSLHELPATDSGAGLSEPARLIGVFMTPGKVFLDLKQSSRWWAPFLLLVLLNIAFAFTLDRTIGFEKAMEQGIRNSPKVQDQFDQLSPEQRAQRIAIGAKFIKYVSYGSSLFLLIVVLIVAAVLMGTFNFGLGKEVRFAPAIAVVMYSLLPTVVYTLMAIMVCWSTSNPDSINLRNVVSTNIAWFLDSSTTSPALYALIRSFDVFYLWSVALMGLGFSAISDTKRSTAVVVVFSWWLLVVLCLSGLTALNS